VRRSCRWQEKLRLRCRANRQPPRTQRRGDPRGIRKRDTRVQPGSRERSQKQGGLVRYLPSKKILDRAPEENQGDHARRHAGEL